MTICKHCNKVFEREEKRGKQFYCSPDCAKEAKRIYNKLHGGKGTVYHRAYRKRKYEESKMPKGKTMPELHLNYDKTEWDELYKLIGC